jgi:NADH:ubiquinone oxidoreductase subunit 3 (subunit A)
MPLRGHIMGAGMDQVVTTNIIYFTIFLMGALLFGFGPIIIVKLLSPTSHTRQTADRADQLIECGMEPIGTAWIRFGIVYYLYALIFLAFDVDVIFLFPVAVAYNHPGLGVQDFFEILLFVAILSLAIVYAWRKGVFTWEKKTYLRQ